jgi:hypothetical protein
LIKSTIFPQEFVMEACRKTSSISGIIVRSNRSTHSPHVASNRIAFSWSNIKRSIFNDIPFRVKSGLPDNS